MKIVHIAPNAPYNDNWGYQENLLPKYQKKMGHNVTLIITNRMHDSNGKLKEIEPTDYFLKDGVHVIRKRWEWIINKSFTVFCSRIKVFDLLCEIKPDLVFFHGLSSCTIFDVIRYKKKNKNCVVVQDNHLDYNIGYKSNGLKNRLIRCWFRLLNKISIKYIRIVYGVTPWRKDYAEDYFGIPKTKTDVLIMGADDDYIQTHRKKEIRKEIRMKYGFSDDDFVVISGGKIDSKKGISTLVKVCAQIPSIKLFLFGSFSDDLAKEINDIFSTKTNIVFLGWLDSRSIYNFFLASDLAFFPGQHSVLWEQACACKIPCVFKHWNGMEHVNNGGNSIFIDEVTKESIENTIKELKWTKKYNQMLQVAQSEATNKYLYSQIAIKSLECLVHSS